MTDDKWIGDHIHWNRAFELPTIEWVKPLLSDMSYPPAIAAAPDKMQSIYIRLRIEQAALERERRAERLRDPTANTRIWVKEGLRCVATEYTPETATELKNWAEEFIISLSTRSVLLKWKTLLLHVAEGRSRHPPPKAMTESRSRWASLVSRASAEAVEAHLKKVAPPPPDEDYLEMSGVALTVREIVIALRARRALAIILTGRSPVEIDEVREWVILEGRARHWSSDEIEQITNYISSEVPNA